MRKIVTPPKPIKCPECGCEFTFEANDVSSVFFSLIGLHRPCRGVRCPVCDCLYVIDKT